MCLSYTQLKGFRFQRTIKLFDLFTTLEQLPNRTYSLTVEGSKVFNNLREGGHFNKRLLWHESQRLEARHAQQKLMFAKAIRSARHLPPPPRRPNLVTQSVLCVVKAVDIK